MTDTKFAALLRRGVAEIITESELLRLLNSGRILNLKQGFDPSAPDIHLGHVVGLRKLRQFQELGHKVTLIVGDWTARIGDPSGQSATRPMLSPDEIESNARTYMEQFFKVVDKDKTELRCQSEWFSGFTLDEVIRLTSKFTIAQLLAREDFSKRYSSGNPISLAEMLYPLLQGYDSVAIKADVEFGGIDQKFNCLVGRELQQSTGQSPQQIFLVPLLIGTDGHQKMSKSLRNHIGIAEPPREIYGKVMSIPDSLILDYFELVTDIPEQEIAEFKEQLKTRSVNPMDLKKRLAHEIVRQFHGKQAGDQAEEQFTRVFQKREIPEEVPEIPLSFKSLMYESLHSRKVFEIATRIASQMGVSSNERRALQIAAALHDIGKMDIPDRVLLKKGALTTSEWTEIKLHVSRSTELLRSLGVSHKIIPNVEAHHEQYDGKGYPRGLSGDQIPLGARIIAVADMYDALTSERPYRRALTNAQALEELREGAGIQFDPAVVEALKQALTVEMSSEDLAQDLAEIGSFADIFHMLLAAKLSKSHEEAKRLLRQNAVEIDGKKVNSNIVSIRNGAIIKVGKLRFAKIVDADEERP
jgi:tyrosyl-tRNA synthetase